MIFHTGQPADFADWQTIVGPEWSSSDIAKSLEELRCELIRREAIESSPEISEIGKAYLVAAREACQQRAVTGTPEIYQRTMRGGRRCSTADIFLESPPPNLAIRTDASVVRIQIDGERATGVVVRDGAVRGNTSGYRGRCLGRRNHRDAATANALRDWSTR